MNKLSLAFLLCCTPFVVQAVPLKVVNVSAPAINCVFVNEVLMDTLMRMGDDIELSAMVSS